MPTNEDYMERWEQSAKTPIASQMTPAEIAKTQGTRLQEESPWETYDREMAIEMSPEVEAAMEELGKRYHDKSSAQNEEELARWKEQNSDEKDEYKWCTEDEYHDIQMRFGRILHHAELITMLRKAGVKCWYRQHPQEDKITLVIMKGDGMLPPEVGCWLKHGYMPEYSVMGFDEHGVPLAERYRGWRTCLLQLIMKKAITEEKAHKVFGRAERGCAERYNSILYGLRNTVTGVID